MGKEKKEMVFCIAREMLKKEVCYYHHRTGDKDAGFICYWRSKELR